VAHCEVCGKQVDEVIVVASALLAQSFSYCKECYDLGVEPYHYWVTLVAYVGSVEDLRDDYQKWLMHDLQLLGKSLEEFNKDVGILYDKIWVDYCLDI
jgi:hypothetical protein